MEGPLRDDAPNGLTLIETLRWEPATGFVRLPAHLARLAAGAVALGISLRPASIERALDAVTGNSTQRVRLTLALDGVAEATFAALAPAKAEWTVTLAPQRLASRDPWLRLKTTRRPVHDAARAALPPDVDEALLLNERGEICEGTITTVFADLGGGLLTPPLACGLLPGILRARLLATGAARESVLRPSDLAGARLFIGNSLRGLVSARFECRA
ncbi:4-amino-4-deoxychorismate lyase [Amaricoccus macauensis]|uniref:Probable branched-chain-amino-acid aminotransferase n=1 Tax=Amaricoccus macauensis TaxID=57001 RepID=A0A840SMF5_9RHOB|nr:4-amino-4-deoxychorismate lyase [Amaricoccus macauensis]